ncbi:MAG: MFS transporter [Microbacterium sp.]
MWVIWIVAVLGYVLAVTNRTSLSAVGVDAAHRFDADASTLSMFAVLQLAVYGFMQIPIGVWLDRFGARPIMVIGMALMASGQLIMALSPNVGIAILARMIIGAGDAAIFPGMARLVALWFPTQRNPLMMQLSGIIGQLGQIVAIIPLATLLHSTSWSVAFGSVAGLGVMFTALIWMVIRNRPPEITRDVSVDTRTGAIRTVTSAIDTSEGGIRVAWQNPGTRLAFWTHFSTPFAGNAFVILWGFPFLTAGEGLSKGQASLVQSLFVFVGILCGPVIGMLSGRNPLRRSTTLVLPIIGIEVLGWMVVIVWPGAAPFWLLLLLAVTLGLGGPASLVAFDHARTHNPAHQLSTATGITNVGGFLAGLLAILFIGIALDVQGAGEPETYTLGAFKLAFLMQLPLWALGAGFILRERRLTRIKLGVHPH